MPWLVVLVVVFLAPGAIALGTMSVAMITGAADVATRDWARGLRRATILATASSAALAWSRLIVWIEIPTSPSAPLPDYLVSGVVALVAAAPPFRLLGSAARDVGRDVVLILALAATLNAGTVAARLILVRSSEECVGPVDANHAWVAGGGLATRAE